MLKSNENIIYIFHELYEIYSAIGDKFRAKSYKKVVDTLSKYPNKITIKTLDDIDELKGFGQKTITKIREILETGHLKLLDQLMKKPDIRAYLELQKVLGIGPQFSRKLIKKYGIRSVEQLKKAKNVSLTKTQRIGLKYFDEFNTPIQRSYMLKYKNNLQKQMRDAIDPAAELILAGSYLTEKKFANDIDIIAITKKKSADIAKYLLESGNAREIINSGAHSIMFVSKDKKHVDLKIVADRGLIPFYLIYFGSGATFAREIRLHAKKMGYKLNQYGLFDKSGNLVMGSAKSDKEIFDKLGLKYVKAANR